MLGVRLGIVVVGVLIAGRAAGATWPSTSISARSPLHPRMLSHDGPSMLVVLGREMAAVKISLGESGSEAVHFGCGHVGGGPWHGRWHLQLLLEMLVESTLVAMLRMARPGVLRGGDGGRRGMSRLSLCIERFELLLLHALIDAIAGVPPEVLLLGCWKTC